MTVFILKLIAMSTMLVDHVAFWLVDNNNVMRNIGRLAFPIYAFLIAESYYHLRDKPDRLKSHLAKLIILSLVSEPLRDQYIRLKWIYWDTQNTLPTLMLGFVALMVSGWWYRKIQQNRVFSVIGSIIMFGAAALGTYIIHSGYEVGGIVLIVLFYLYLNRANKLGIQQKLGLLFLINIVYICTYIWASAGFGSWPAITEASASFNRRLIGSLIAIIPLAFYNRKLGYHSKWFSWLYSVFYPLQFAVLIIARYLIKGF